MEIQQRTCGQTISQGKPQKLSEGRSP
jgi:hypothetical protein